MPAKSWVFLLCSLVQIHTLEVAATERTRHRAGSHWPKVTNLTCDRPEVMLLEPKPEPSVGHHPIPWFCTALRSMSSGDMGQG